MSYKDLPDREYFKLLDAVNTLRERYPDQTDNLTDDQILTRLYQTKKGAPKGS